MGKRFHQDMQSVLDGPTDNPTRTGGCVLHDDARYLKDAVDGVFDLIVTSPPYANRMSQKFRYEIQSFQSLQGSCDANSGFIKFPDHAHRLP